MNTTPEYPSTHRDDITENFHDTPVADPYRWLEDDSSEDTARWVAKQNRVSSGYLSAIPFRNKVRERLINLWNYPKEGIPEKHGKWYYFSRNDGLRNQAVVCRTKMLGGEVEVFLDPNLFSEDGTVALSSLSFSGDGRFCAYSVSAAGSDWADVRFVDTDTMETLPEVIKWVKFSFPAWSSDSRGFYYSAYDAPGSDAYSGQNRFHKVFFHTLGKTQSQDELIYWDQEHPLRYFHGQESRDGRWLFIHGSEGTHGAQVLFRERGKDEFRVLFPGFENDYELIHAQDDKAYFHTNDAAPNSRLVEIDLNLPLGDRRNIIPEKANSPLESVTFVGGNFFAVYLSHASAEVEIFNIDGFGQGRVELEGLGSVIGFTGKPDDSQTFYSFTNFTSPPQIYRYHIATGCSELLTSSAVNFDSNLYVTDRIFFISEDGTQVPMFVVHSKDMVRDGRNSLLMYGYGGFNISRTPTFNPSVIMFLEQGGTYVEVILRGGGEYGEEWHRAGMLENKQNVFDDFIAAAEYLIIEKYTSPDKLAIMGGSNGGLLVGACMTQRPELFAVAVPQVGVLDMLRYHRFTIGWGWVVEYGDPDNPDDFKYIYKYSPLHNIVDGRCYPATLITTGDHDDRVVPAHSFKFAAALQRAQGCANPVLLRVDTDAGHGAGKPTAKRIEESADIYSFILYETGADVDL